MEWRSLQGGGVPEWTGGEVRDAVPSEAKGRRATTSTPSTSGRSIREGHSTGGREPRRALSRSERRHPEGRSEAEERAIARLTPRRPAQRQDQHHQNCPGWQSVAEQGERNISARQPFAHDP
jgi:hypothetical protein